MKTPANLDPSLSRELVSLRKKTADLPAVITSDAEQERVGAMQSTVRDLVKSIESWYDRHLKPLNDALKSLRAEKKALLEEPESWLSRASRLLSDYYLKKEREAERERERLQRQLDKEAAAARRAEVSALRKSGDKDGAVALAEAPVVAPVAEVENTAALDGRSFRLDVEVVILDLAAVPDEYVERSLRLADVKRAWRSGVKEIPGLQLHEIRTLVNRA